MEKSIEIPDGIDISLEEYKVKVKGPLGELERDFYTRGFANIIKIQKDKNKIIISSSIDNKKYKAILGSISAHINNMIKGVTSGFTYKLKITYTHFPMNIEQKDNEIIVRNFLGQKDIRKGKILDGVKVEIKKDEIIVSGTDIELVGQTAANIEQATRLCGKDRRRFQDGIFIVEKPK